MCARRLLACATKGFNVHCGERVDFPAIALGGASQRRNSRATELVLVADLPRIVSTVRGTCMTETNLTDLYVVVLPQLVLLDLRGRPRHFDWPTRRCP